MKKLLFALALGIVLVLAIASVASADNGPHGGFNGSTDACASCHRIHSAVSNDEMLLVASNIYTLCTNCHDGTGAATNVVDGFYDTGLVAGVDRTSTGTMHKTLPTAPEGEAGYGLFGGGFVNARMLTDWGNAKNEGTSAALCPDIVTPTTNLPANCGLADTTLNAPADRNNSLTSWARFNAYDTGPAMPASRPTTSNHDVSTVARSGTVWGSGTYVAAGTLAGNWGAATWTGVGTATSQLECTSCHTPHGNGGIFNGKAYPSYRLLSYTPKNSNGFETATEVGTTGWWDIDLTWNASTPGAGQWNPAALVLSGNTVVPFASGVFLPDPAFKWYTPNTDVDLDYTIAAHSGKLASATALSSVSAIKFAGRGDYGAQANMYKRPRYVTGDFTTSTALGATYLGCRDASNVFTTGAGNVIGNCALYGAAATVANSFNNVAPHDVAGYWCSTCHDRYFAPGGSSATTGSRVDSTANAGVDPGYHYRHRAQQNSANIGTGVTTCLDCHNSHGTAATSNGFAALAQTATAMNASYAGGSVLLKGDNRAICVRCHSGAAPNTTFFNVSTSPYAPTSIP